MSLKLPVYSELVKAFYSNLEIQESTLIYEVFGIIILTNPYSMTYPII